MTIDPSNYNTKCRTNSASKKMEEEENEGLRTVESLRGRLLAERQVSRSVKEEAELITRKMEGLERHLKEEIRLREKAEKRLKSLMKKLDFIKGSRRQSSEGSEQLSPSEDSCISSVSTSASKEEEENHENGVVVEEKTDHATENVASMEDDQSGSKCKDVNASTSSHEEESETGNDSSRYSDTNSEFKKQESLFDQNHLSR